jgi:polar amino acid transport system substrate-binding protein
MRLMLALIVGIALGACDIPRDPEGTLQRVRGDEMLVGATEADPFVIFENGEPAAGVEVRLVEAMAADFDAEIDWVTGSEEQLLAALEVGELDLVIGGLTSTNPWSANVTFTHPYLTTFTGVGVPEQEQVGEDIAGMKVSAEKGSDIIGLLRETDAQVVEVDDIAFADGAAAIENWLFDDLDLYDSDVRLNESDHVMAVPHGENAWLSAVERFLLEREDEIESILEEEGAL